MVHVQAEAPAPLVPGTEGGEAVVKFSILPGFQIMSDRPSKPNYIATAITFDGANPSDVTTGVPSYPPPTAFTMGDESIRTFQGSGTIRAGVEAAKGAKAGDRTLKGALRYQSCTQRDCLFPRSEPFEIRLRIDG